MATASQFSLWNSQAQIMMPMLWHIVIWCNGPERGCSLDLQVDVGTSGRNEDDDALSSDWPGDDALFTGWHSSRSAVTRGWSRWTRCSFPYKYHIGRQAATSISRCCLAERVDALTVVRGTVDCDLLEVDLWAVVRGTERLFCGL